MVQSFYGKPATLGRRIVESEERKQFVRSHRTCIFGYNRKNDGPSMSVTYYMMDGPDTILVSTMAQRGKAKAVQRNPKVSICVLDEKWAPTYLQVYCDARIEATMESDPERVIDSMMRLYESWPVRRCRSRCERKRNRLRVESSA
jgi:nitroimidazol reductase NimA-like FMN-containing flavoprotein (pyridoxamine 5'-phosphate oxidase superfamily)